MEVANAYARIESSALYDTTNYNHAKPRCVCECACVCKCAVHAVHGSRRGSQVERLWRRRRRRRRSALGTAADDAVRKRTRLIVLFNYAPHRWLAVRQVAVAHLGAHRCECVS